jgi:hypothetical protein
VTVTIADGTLTLAKGERILLATDIRGRFSRLRFDAGLVAFEAPPLASPGGTVRLPGIEAERARGAWAGDAALAWRAGEGGIVLSLPVSEARQSVRFAYAAARRA